MKTSQTKAKISISVPLLFFSILLLTFALYWPALAGPFLLDDFTHLPRLASGNGNIDSISEILEFMFSGPSTTGRPLSFLTFLINDNAWPSNSYGFKYTNLLIHLLNGVLVFVLMRQLASIISGEDKTDRLDKVNKLALLSMLIWLIHPINISASMLVIQRMTLLMATFSLIGMNIYLYGRFIVQNQMRRGYLLMSIGVAAFGVLGALSKETAVMMVTYLIVIEYTIFSAVKVEKPPYWRYWLFLFTILPLILVILYFIKDMAYMDQLYLKRTFSMQERVMTEARVLMTYLRVIILPSISSTGPYHDDFVVSRGMLNPVTTFLSIITIISSIIFAIKYRVRYPLFAMAILWFFFAHSLESTVLPLELYFEHRNYLPMLGFVFLASYWTVFRCSRKLGPIIAIFVSLFIVLESGITYATNRVWGSEPLIAKVWAYEHPASLRAQFDVIRHWLTLGNTQKASEHFQISHQHNPNVAGIYLYELLINHCTKLTIPHTLKDDFHILESIIPSAEFEHSSLEVLRLMVEKYRKGKCSIKLDDILRLTKLYLKNDKFRRIDHIKAMLHEIESEIYIEKGDLSGAIEGLDKAYTSRPRYNFPLMQAYYLATAGLYKDALSYIEVARNTKPHDTYSRYWKERQIRDMEEAIKQAINENAAPTFDSKTSVSDKNESK